MQVESLEPRRLFAGVTLLAHGFNSDTTGWVTAVANAIEARAGGPAAVSQYALTVTAGRDHRLAVSGFAAGAGSANPLQTSAGEIIVKLDWSSVSQGSFPTGAVAAVVSRFMLLPHDGLPPLASLPIDLIGHSRGASLNAALSRDLGRAGVWVDQMTSLDPHPVDGINDPLSANFHDAPMRSYDNVEFADDYWRTDGNPQSLDFNGEPVDGAHNVSLADSVQANHGENIAHEEVPAYYDGTIDLTATRSANEPILDAWYAGTPSLPSRDQTGFIFSRLAGGARPADGLSAAFGGSAARVAAGRSGAQWADVADVEAPASATIGGALTLSYRYESRAGAASIAFYFDTDSNPLNGFAGSLTSGRLGAASGPKTAMVSATTANIVAGNYFVAAAITDARHHVRYAYSKTAVSLPPA